jgi:hypothetical protein
MGNSTKNINFQQLKDKNFVEFEQLAFIALVRKSNGALALTTKEIHEAYGFVCDVDTTFPDKVVFRVKPRPADFDKAKAQEFFDAAESGTWQNP